jgi:cytosine/adenosine deaminase-related metal-dependent hydrolase
MNVRKVSEIGGNIYINGKFRHGILRSTDGKIEFQEERKTDQQTGTLIPLPVNSHTHVGDSFVREEPTGNLAQVVGPNGFKLKKLGGANPNEIMRGIRRSLIFMRNTGTGSFIDFRESDLAGTLMLDSVKVKGIRKIILGRASDPEEAIKVLKVADGFSFSAVSDANVDEMKKLSEIAHKSGKIVAIHFSENTREDFALVMKLNPDLLVHGIAANEDDLQLISRMKIPVAVTPRSNYFFGIRHDYSKFLNKSVQIMIGTDNVMITEPDIFEEMSFLYRVQRSINRISPEDILKMSIDNPYEFLKKHGLSTDSQRYLFFPGAFLSAYEIITKFHILKKSIVEIAPVKE